jgi:hypothetical protein
MAKAQAGSSGGPNYGIGSVYSLPRIDLACSPIPLPDPGARLGPIQCASVHRKVAQDTACIVRICGMRSITSRATACRVTVLRPRRPVGLNNNSEWALLHTANACLLVGSFGFHNSRSGAINIPRVLLVVSLPLSGTSLNQSSETMQPNETCCSRAVAQTRSRMSHSALSGVGTDDPDDTSTIQTLNHQMLGIGRLSVN